MATERSAAMTVDERTPLLDGSSNAHEDTTNPALDAEVVRDEMEGVKPKVSMLKIVRSIVTLLCSPEFV